MAANYIFGLGKLVPTTATVVAFLAFTATPAYTRGQQPDTVKLKADAQSAFNIISSEA